MNNLHITLTEFRNESRILKETMSIYKHGLVEGVYVAALYDDDLTIDQIYNNFLLVRRFNLRTRRLSRNIFVQMLKYIEFCFRVYAFYKRKNINLVNIHSLALLPLGVILKFAFNAKLVYDTHELETEKSCDRGVRQKIIKNVEEYLIKQVDMTIVVSDSIADWYQKTYNIRRPPVLFNAPSRRELKRGNHFRKELGIRTDQLILLYQGGLEVGRGVVLILDAFKARRDDKVVAVFMGYGLLEQSIKNVSTECNNVFYYPAVAPHVVLEYTSSADFGIHLIQNTCLNHYYCMPNKLFEYAMSGLPVLVSNMKDMSSLVVSNQMGSVISDFSVAGINQAIDHLLAQDTTLMKDNAYRVATENSWEIQEEKMLTAYERIGVTPLESKKGIRNDCYS